MDAPQDQNPTLTRDVGQPFGAGPLTLVALGETTYQQLPVEPPCTLTLGRDPACEVHLPEDALSRRHAKFILDDRAWVEDLGSKNGTFLGGLRLQPCQPVHLQVGEILECASVLVVLRRKMVDALAEGGRSPGPSPPGLEVAPDGSWFSAPAWGRVELGRRGAMRRILTALAELRQTLPGACLSAESLIQVGWPGQKASQDSAMGSVYVTMRRRRVLGLEGVLQTLDAGYRLNPDHPLHWAPMPSAKP